MSLGYDTRMDGNYLIRKKCPHCSLEYDVHAMQNSDAVYGDYCAACVALFKWEAKEGQ